MVHLLHARLSSSDMDVSKRLAEIRQAGWSYMFKTWKDEEEKKKPRVNCGDEAILYAAAMIGIGAWSWKLPMLARFISL